MAHITVKEVPGSKKQLLFSAITSSTRILRWMSEARVSNLGDLEGKDLYALPGERIGSQTREELQKLLNLAGCKLEIHAEGPPVSKAVPLHIPEGYEDLPLASLELPWQVHRRLWADYPTLKQLRSLQVTNPERHAMLQQALDSLSKRSVKKYRLPWEREDCFTAWVDRFMMSLPATESHIFVEHFGGIKEERRKIKDMARERHQSNQSLSAKMINFLDIFKEQYAQPLEAKHKEWLALTRPLAWEDLHTGRERALFRHQFYFSFLHRLLPEVTKGMDKFAIQYREQLQALFLYVNRMVGKCTVENCIAFFKQLIGALAEEDLLLLNKHLHDEQRYRIETINAVSYVIPRYFHWLTVVETIVEASPTPLAIDKIRELGQRFADYYRVKNSKVPALSGLLKDSEKVIYFGPSIYGAQKHIQLPTTEWPAITKDFVDFLRHRKRMTSTLDFLSTHPQWAERITHQELTLILQDAKELKYVRKGNFVLQGQEAKILSVKDILLTALHKQPTHPLSEMRLVSMVKEQRSFFGQQVGNFLKKIPECQFYGYGFYGLAKKSTEIMKKILMEEDFYRSYSKIEASSITSLKAVCKKVHVAHTPELADTIFKASRKWGVIVCVRSETLLFFRKNVPLEKLSAALKKFLPELSVEARHALWEECLEAAGRPLIKPKSKPKSATNLGKTPSPEEAGRVMQAAYTANLKDSRKRTLQKQLVSLKPGEKLVVNLNDSPWKHFKGFIASQPKLSKRNFSFHRLGAHQYEISLSGHKDKAH